MPADGNHEDAPYELVMPFVTVNSKGGPHDDQSFTAGWECGALDARLQAMAGVGCVVERVVLAELVPQLDLIAMKHGLQLRQDPADHEYVHVRIGAPSILDGGDER